MSKTCPKEASISRVADFDQFEGCNSADSPHLTIENFTGNLKFPNITLDYAQPSPENPTLDYPTIEFLDNPGLKTVDLSAIISQTGVIDVFFTGNVSSMDSIVLPDDIYFHKLDLTNATTSWDVSVQGGNSIEGIYVGDKALTIEDPIYVSNVTVSGGCYYYDSNNNTNVGFVTLRDLQSDNCNYYAYRYPDNAMAYSLTIENASTDKIGFYKNISVGVKTGESPMTDDLSRAGGLDISGIYSTSENQEKADFGGISTVYEYFRLKNSNLALFDFSGLSEFAGSLDVTGNRDCSFDFGSLNSLSNITMVNNTNSPVPGDMRQLQQADHIELSGIIDGPSGSNIFPRLVTADSVTVRATNSDFDCSVLEKQQRDGTITNLECSGGSSTTPSTTTGTNSVATSASTSPSSTKSSLSTGAKAGVGVAVAAIGVGILAALLLFWKRRHNNKYPEGDESVVLGPYSAEPSDKYLEVKEPVQPQWSEMPADLYYRHEVDAVTPPVEMHDDNPMDSTFRGRENRGITGEMDCPQSRSMSFPVAELK